MSDASVKPWTEAQEARARKLNEAGFDPTTREMASALLTIDAARARLAEVEKDNETLTREMTEERGYWSRAWEIMAGSHAGQTHSDEEIVEAARRLVAKLAAAEARVERYEKALREIKDMGRVCDNFELCKHPSCSDSCGAALTASAALDAAPPPESARSKIDAALAAWARWYSAKLERITERGGGGHESYSGAEQDLFEALGCVAGAPETAMGEVVANVPPKCGCGVPMVLQFWERPGGLPGNGWRCPRCHPLIGER